MMWEIWPPGVVIVPVVFVLIMMIVHGVHIRRYRRRAVEAERAAARATAQPKKTSASA